MEYFTWNRALVDDVFKTLVLLFVIEVVQYLVFKQPLLDNQFLRLVSMQLVAVVLYHGIADPHLGETVRDLAGVSEPVPKTEE